MMPTCPDMSCPVRRSEWWSRGSCARHARGLRLQAAGSVFLTCGCFTMSSALWLPCHYSHRQRDKKGTHTQREREEIPKRPRPRGKKRKKKDRRKEKKKKN